MPGASGLGRRDGLHELRPRAHRRRAFRPTAPSPAALGLLPILALQAALSARLLHANTAFRDEALYLWVGHLEIARWLHGIAIPAFPTYLSGSPLLYPPLGALADHVGGLVGARVLSLAFMLATTVLLWGVAADLLGRRAAWFAAALFALCGPTIRLGAFATFDAMALALLAAAALCAVRAGDRATRSGWLAAAALVLALANATKYATAVFDPVVLALGALSAARHHSWRRAAALAGTLAVYGGCIVGFLVALGGGGYVQGILQTTLARRAGTDTAAAVLGTSWHLTALVLVLAGAGALAALLAPVGLPVRAAVLVAAAAALVVPAEQARIHTLTSLGKHVDFGAFFAAAAGGFALDRLLRGARPRPARWLLWPVLLVLLAGQAQVASAQALALFRSWPSSTRLVRAVGGVLRSHPGPILAEQPSLLEYSLREGRRWYLFSNTSSIRLADGRSLSAGVGKGIDVPLLQRFLRRGYFSVIVLTFGSAAAIDPRLVATMRRDAHYRLVDALAYGPRGAQVWAYEPARPRLAAIGPPRPAVPVLRDVFDPLARPSTVLGAVAAAVEAAGLATVAFTVLVRLGWRRRKASSEP